MALELIHGPPGSGRVLSILDRYVAAIAADPVLVVPTSDDVDRLERELCGRPGGILGGTVTTLPGLFREVGHELGIAEGPLLTRLQRIRLARAAAAELPLRRLARSASHAGFAPALERLLSDLQSAGLDATAFAHAVEAAGSEIGDGAYEREIAALFEAYERNRDRLGFTDAHQHAAAITTALRAEPRRWRGRPVLLYGFDDLDREQIELIAALAADAPVTVAVAYEDRPALAARAELLGVLRDELGGTIAESRAAEPGRDVRPSSTLRHLERNLFDPGAEGIETDGSVHLLEGTGERSTTELIGRRIAALLAAGSDPDEIAVAVRNPDASAPQIVRALSELGIPVAAEARIPLLNTATGAALDELLTIAAGEGSAETVISLLRRPARARPDNVDYLERNVLRKRIETAEEALEIWAGQGREGDEEPRRIRPLEELLAAGDDPAAVSEVLARFAAEVAERTHARSAFIPSGTAALELRAAGVVAKALAEVSALGELAPRRPGELRRLLESLQVPLWSGSSEGRVRVLSPYRLRGARIAHLFVAGLADGAFPAPNAADPLLSDERRRALGLPGRSDPAVEERYLFYVCVAKPEASLSLAYPAADEDGRPLARSPFVDEVRGLLSPAPTPEAADDPLEAEIAARAQLTDFVPAPQHACSARDLARALAASGGGERQLEAMALEGEAQATATRMLGRVRGAAERSRRAREPGPLRDPDVLAALAATETFGASTLEGYDVCSYRWFVSHELRPRSIEPDAEPLETGGIMHEALERLYREGPAGSRRPEPGNVRRWIDRGEELLAEVASGEGRGWNLDSSPARITLRRLGAILARYLRRDAALGGMLQPDPDLLEARFGDEEGARFPAADLGEFKLRGAIDRIDVAEGKALIRDYKLSASVTPVAKFEKEGRLQLPLYMLAARQFGLDPIGGLYSPLAASKEKDTRPRGLLAKDYAGTLISDEGEHHVKNDFREEEEFEEAIGAGLEAATTIVRKIRGGEVDRDPREGSCPSYCEYAPICRMERTLPLADEEDEEIV